VTQPSCPRSNPENRLQLFLSLLAFKGSREACSCPLCDTNNFLSYTKDVGRLEVPSSPPSSPATPGRSRLLPTLSYDL